MTDLTAHFGLRILPFTREIPVEQLYPHPQRQELLAMLRRVVEQRMSAALIAAAGLGKTSLLRQLIDDLPDVRYRVHYVKVTGLSKRDMCREIAKSLVVHEAGTYPRGLELQLDMLMDVFAAAHRDGDRTALRDQARAMTRIGRVLADQIRVYRDLIEATADLTASVGR